MPASGGDGWTYTPNRTAMKSATVGLATYTWKVTDADGDAAQLTFTIADSRRPRAVVRIHDSQPILEAVR